MTALCWAVFDVIERHILQQGIPVWNAFALQGIGFFISCVPLFFILKDARNEFFGLTGKIRLVGVMAINQVIVFVSLLLVLTAILVAPYVSLVPAIGATRPLFTFAYVIFFTLFLPK
jgi:hypothetical protein